jgi:hypothetical protein
MLHLLAEVLKNSYLITSLVLVMMIMIEYVNVASAGKWFGKLHNNSFRQVVMGALLGLIPGCIGGFAAVSLYSHGIIGLGALVAAMVSSSGDEAFVMLAMIPRQAVILFGVLFVIGVVSGVIVDRFGRKRKVHIACENHFELHDAHIERVPAIFKLSSYSGLKNPSKELLVTLAGILVFVVAVFSGILEHSHDHHSHIAEPHHLESVAEHHIHTEDCHHDHFHSHSDEGECTHNHLVEEHIPSHSAGFDIFSERWLNIVFACLSIVVLFLVAASDTHFFQEHIWGHVIKHHALKVFLWTAGALLVIQVGLQYLDITAWLRDNVYLMILLAALVGMIPESGPNMVFITLFASGLAPFSVLLTSSISQDGHTSLPLLASSKRDFIVAKVLNALIAVVVGSLVYLAGF